MRTLESILAEHPFFAGLEPRYVQVIAGCASNVVFEEGRIIFREGEEADRFYLIREGRVALEVHAAGIGTLTIQTLDAGDILGWSWLVPPYRWHFDARAIEQTRAIALDGECLRRKCEEDHDLGYELLKRFAEIITQRLQATRLQLLDVYSARR
ncbi:MAG: cyclic nucleotide-binding domain-containing protein [Armatimonadota bacterium]|nr:cyclic nucleotide-binding domain-containing protein [Armatimonadota bacterium]MDW8291384.1 cyclic nucleotide-binding domain-containing protein [Armatimonadota bacterium]